MSNHIKELALSDTVQLYSYIHLAKKNDNKFHLHLYFNTIKSTTIDKLKV